MVSVTQHAAKRYVERVAPHMTILEARATIMGHAEAIGRAAAFGASALKLGDGTRLMLSGYFVVTVKTSHDPIIAPTSQTMLKAWKRKARREAQHKSEEQPK